MRNTKGRRVFPGLLGGFPSLFGSFNSNARIPHYTPWTSTISMVPGVSFGNSSLNARVDS